MNQRAHDIFQSIEKAPESPYVFRSAVNGGRVQDIRKSFSTALKRCGIKDFHFHDLRHTAASHLVMAGVDLNTVREILRHRSLDMTLRYAHLSPDHKMKAVEVLGEALV